MGIDDTQRSRESGTPRGPDQAAGEAMGIDPIARTGFRVERGRFGHFTLRTSTKA
jgi:hypothetical protein